MAKGMTNCDQDQQLQTSAGQANGLCAQTIPITWLFYNIYKQFQLRGYFTIYIYIYSSSMVSLKIKVYVDHWEDSTDHPKN